MKRSAPAKKKLTQASARKAAYGTVTKAAGAARKTASASVKLPPPGYTRNPGNKLLVPTPRKNAPATKLVPASKLQAGIAQAQESISEVLHQLVEAARENYEITEIELSASFSADGKFLGFGVGGEMSITFRVKPAEA